MTLKSEQFLVDKRGHAKAIILSLMDYRKLVRHLHDLEDALDLKHAVATGRGTISHSALLGQLKRNGIV
jgi:hypothetical protein